MFWYEFHLGGVYFSKQKLDNYFLFCEKCGESDTYIGKAETFADAWNLLKDKCAYSYSGGLDLQHVFNELCVAYRVHSKFAETDKDERICEDEILKEIHRITGEEVNVFLVEDREDPNLSDCIFADSEEEAERRFAAGFGDDFRIPKIEMLTF